MDQKQTAMETLMASIQRQWGTIALQPLRELAARPALPGLSTGFEVLDAVLGVTGIPHGQTTELVGKPTSGMTTLAFRIMAAAQHQKQYALYVDLESTFDPDYAVQCGVDLHRLFLARPETEVDALDIARDLIEKGDVGVIVLDLGQLLPDVQQIRRLSTILSHSGCVVLLLISLTDGTTSQSVINGGTSALRLFIERDSWLTHRTDIRGYRAQVVIFGRHFASGKRVSIDIDIETGHNP